MDIRTLLDHGYRLPIIPKVAHLLIQSLISDTISSVDVARQINSDPALTAKLLRLANSAQYNLSKTISTAEDALRMLGFVSVRNLVLGSGMVTAFGDTSGMDLKLFWRYSIYTACASRWLAAETQANTDLVFLVGLIHGIGQLQMHLMMPLIMAPMDYQMSIFDVDRPQLEKTRFNFNYCNVSAEMAGLWNFPKPIINALEQVLEPLASEELSWVAGLVHLGAWRARAQIQNSTDSEMIHSYPVELARRMRIASNWLPMMPDYSEMNQVAHMPPLVELTEGLENMFE